MSTTPLISRGHRQWRPVLFMLIGTVLDPGQVAAQVFQKAVDSFWTSDVPGWIHAYPTSGQGVLLTIAKDGMSQLARLDAAQDILWSRAIISDSTDQHSFYEDLAIDPDDNVLLITDAFAIDDVPYAQVIVLALVDENGAIVWSKQCRFPINYPPDNNVNAAVQWAGDGFLVNTCSKDQGLNTGECITFKVDLGGNVVWSSARDLSAEPAGVEQRDLRTIDGGFIAVYTHDGLGNEPYDVIVEKRDGQGGFVWGKKVHMTNSPWHYSNVMPLERPDGRIVLIGEQYDPEVHPFALELDTSGSVLRYVFYGEGPANRVFQGPMRMLADGSIHLGTTVQDVLDTAFNNIAAHGMYYDGSADPTHDYFMHVSTDMIGDTMLFTLDGTKVDPVFNHIERVRGVSSGSYDLSDLCGLVEGSLATLSDTLVPMALIQAEDLAPTFPAPFTITDTTAVSLPDALPTLLPFCQITGVEGIDGTSTPLMRVFPDPVSTGDRITIVARTASIIELRDALGRLVCSADMSAEDKLEWSTGGLSMGLYIVRALDAAGRTMAAQRLIVQ